MPATDDDAPDISALKAGLHATWAAGDYARVATALAASAEAFLDRVPFSRGDRLLDIACGSGQLAIPAARRGAIATGVDLVPTHVEAARARAEEAGVEASFAVADAEDLPFRDGAFDVTVSLIGAMFAPRPRRAAAELLRVTRPGGRIAMGNWTPDGFVGDFFRTVARHVPPPEMPSPLLWGTEEEVRARLGEGVADLEMRRTTYRLDYDMTPDGVVEHYRRNFGPVVQAFAALDLVGQEALARDLRALWSGANTASGGRTRVDAGILEVQATRAPAQ